MWSPPTKFMTAITVKSENGRERGVRVRDHGVDDVLTVSKGDYLADVGIGVRRVSLACAKQGNSIPH